jgi:hypothetical protein
MALITAALCTGVSAFAPAEVCASGCQLDWWPVQEWGMGYTCFGAIDNCLVRAERAAENSCAAINKSLCAFGTFTYGACYQAGSQKKVDCVLQYKCEGGPDEPF